jgi:hypothetical protein
MNNVPVLFKQMVKTIMKVHTPTGEQIAHASNRWLFTPRS